MIYDELIEVYIINFNGENTILTTIDSIYNSINVKVKITILDDKSTDGSPALIKEHYPEIPIEILPYNSKRANILRNKAFKLAKSKYVFCTDNDLKYDEECLFEMIKVMETDDKIASCTPRLMYWDQPEKVYTTGTKVHYLGATIATEREKLVEEIGMEIGPNSGGGICLVNRTKALEVGGFDVDYLMGWGDDGEFYQRLIRSGYKCLYVPKAIALHENKMADTIRKIRVIGQTYNRWLFILTHYSILLIFLLLPVLILYEIIQALFVLFKGVLPEYIKGNLNVVKNIGLIIKKRKKIQKLKKVSDKEALYSGPLYVSPTLIQKYTFVKIIINFLSSIFNIYWKIIVRIIP